MKAPSEFGEDDKRESESNWQMGFTSTPSFDTIGSKAAFTTHNLQILLKHETPSDRQIIPATLLEKLSYYRAFVSSPSKTQIVSMQQILFNKYLWYYIFDVFCKSLPSTYVYVFLSSYAPNEHIFVPKMIPLCYGKHSRLWNCLFIPMMGLLLAVNSNYVVLWYVCLPRNSEFYKQFYSYLWYCIISAFFLINNYCEYIALLWDYVITGFLYKNPWNRCSSSSYYVLSANTTCYDVYEFSKKIENQTLIFHTYGYIIPSDLGSGHLEIFQVAPLLFLESRITRYSFKSTNFWMFETLVFTIACVFYRQLFKKYIWKMLHCAQCVLILMYLLAFCHLLTFYFMYGFKKIRGPIGDIAVQIWNADVDVLAESMACPPVVHILSARGTEKIKVNRDSTRIIVSNAVYYIFRGLLACMIKRYCEHMIGAPLYYSELNPCASLFYWPIYFSYFYLGDYYTLIYFLLNGIEEFLVMAVTLYCLIEALACEWPKLKPRYIAVSVSILDIVVTSTISVTHRSIIYVFMTAISTLTETIVVFCLYPLGRLVDDMTFHCGAPPTQLRIWNFRFTPIFYTIKIIVMFQGLMDIFIMLGIPPYCFYVLYVIPFVLGSFYAIYNVIFRKKQGWKQLFIPVPEWGPKDPELQRLRHQYDSRQYIGSQAPRKLSRYFIEKAELTTCEVDIRYDYVNKQRDYAVDVKFEDEKKNV